RPADAEAFEAAELGDVEAGVIDAAGVVEVDGDLGVTLDAADGVDDDALAHGSSSVPGSAWDRTALEAPPPQVALGELADQRKAKCRRSLQSQCVPRRSLGTRGTHPNDRCSAGSDGDLPSSKSCNTTRMRAAVGGQPGRKKSTSIT